jgi:hypothetical protein
MKVKILISLLVIAILFSFSSRRQTPVKPIKIETEVLDPNENREPLEPFSMVDQGQFD